MTPDLESVAISLPVQEGPLTVCRAFTEWGTTRTRPGSAGHTSGTQAGNVTPILLEYQPVITMANETP